MEVLVMKIQLIRHATMLIEVQGKRILVDPMLSAAGKMAAVPDVANSSDNPLVDLPVDPSLLLNADAIMVTHTHRDHFDDEAIKLLPPSNQLFCQPSDEERILKAGFTKVQAIEQSHQWDGIAITRTEGQHGTGSIGQKMGPVSGFLLESQGEPSLYIAGDTIWCPEVEYVLEKYQPQIIVCFAGNARFSSGDPITMTKEDIHNVCKHAPSSKIVAVHLEAWNHCSLTRKELKDYIEENSLIAQVYIPYDGEWMSF
jgi:L-ascorbate metabolism protein UlaG (beta-lactamase superfamily)